MARTFTQLRIKEAVERGYYVDEQGRVYGPKGPLSIKAYGKQRYPTIGTNWNYIRYSIPAHCLAAYCFYGDESFTEGLVVRHLNGNRLDLSKLNIALGTAKENAQDVPKAERVARAKHARKAQGYSSMNRKLTDKEVEEIKNFYRNLKGKRPEDGEVKKLTVKYSVSRNTICKHRHLI